MKPLIAFASIVVLAVAACSSPTPAPEPAKEVVVPELAKLQAAAAQYAPTEIGADLSKLPANEQQALAKLVQAGWIMDALFLRQVVGRQRRHAAEPAHRPLAARPGPHALLPDQQGTLGPSRPQRAVHRRRSGQAGRRELLSRRRDEGRHRGVAEGAAGIGARQGDGFLHHHQAADGREGRQGRIRHRALQRRVPGRAGARRRVAARGRRADGPAHA